MKNEKDLFMKRTLDNIFKTIIIGGLMTAAAATTAWADVVEVSSLPGTAVSQAAGYQAATSTNYVIASGNYSQNTVTTPVITAVSSLSDASQSTSYSNVVTSASSSSGTAVSVPIIIAESNVTAVSTSSSTASVSTGNTISVPVIDAVGTADSYMTSADTSSYVDARTAVSAASVNNQNVTETTPVVVAGGSTDDASAQEATTSEVGFCVLLGSSPTGTMKDITG
ncbi:hypothetical protein UYO_0851 [Lachnospiraceae bacterium JC7]|nr:hypothetical protein UYO_0851 [Lachnospiraceae bacterium JC7]